MRASKILLRSLFKLTPLSMFKQKTVLKVAATSIGLGLTTWYSTIKLTS